jgi:hypothetical protein
MHACIDITSSFLATKFTPPNLRKLRFRIRVLLLPLLLLLLVLVLVLVQVLGWGVHIMAAAHASTSHLLDCLRWGMCHLTLVQQ